jgi:hypothetical protein
MRVGRFFAWLFLALGIGFLCWALIPMLQGGKFDPDPLGKVWFTIHPGSLQILQPAIERHVAPWLWSDIVQPVLVTPAYVDFLVLGAVLALIFRRRRGRAQ